MSYNKHTFYQEHFPKKDRNLLYTVWIYKKAIFCDLGNLANTDMVALMADFFLRFSGISWSFVMGTSDARLIFSVRTKRSDQNAGRMARRMVKGLGSAGGHGRTGGGQIPIEEFSPEKAGKMRRSLEKRFLKFAGQENAAEERLLPSGPLVSEPPSLVFPPPMDGTSV